MILLCIRSCPPIGYGNHISHNVRIRCHQERIASWSKLYVQTPEFLKFHLLNKNVLNSFCRKFSNHIVLTEQKNRVRKNLRSEKLEHLHIIFKLSVNKWSLDERTQRLWPVAVRTDSVMLQHECLLCLSLACCAVETNHVVSVHKTEELTWMVVHNLIWFIYDNEVFIIRYESQVLLVHHTLLARCPPQWLEELRVTHSQIVIWNDDANFPRRSLQYC